MNEHSEVSIVAARDALEEVLSNLLKLRSTVEEDELVFALQYLQIADDHLADSLADKYIPFG